MNVDLNEMHSLRGLIIMGNIHQIQLLFLTKIAYVTQ